jgi:hypothetical protein
MGPSSGLPISMRKFGTRFLIVAVRFNAFSRKIKFVLLLIKLCTKNWVWW